MAQTNGIGSSQLLGTLLGQADKVAAGKREAALTSGVSSASAADKAQLSSAGSSLAQSVGNGDDVRTAKVDAIRAALTNGTYHVPAAAVADKLIESLLGH